MRASLARADPSVDLSDLGNDAVDTVAHLLRGLTRRLARRASIVPDGPVRLVLLDVLGQHPLVLSVVPLSDIRVGREGALGRWVIAEELSLG